jgi:predicted dehydrogenase
MRKTRLAIIGCGAVTELFHLPGIALSRAVELTTLVDRDLARAQTLARRYNVPVVLADYRELFGKVDAAVVALPNYLHTSATIDLLNNGIHVLVEKPMALTTKECDAMIETAQNQGLVLAVGLIRRFYRSSQYIKSLLEEGVLGEIGRFEFREGSIFHWPIATSATFCKEKAGGGVLVDVGAHVLDLLLWWFGECLSVDYRDDAMGGVEADCEIRLKFRSGVEGVIELSRTRQLENICRIYGSRGTLEFETEYCPLMRMTLRGRNYPFVGRIVEDVKLSQKIPEAWDIWDVFRRQIDDFAAAINRDQGPFISGQEGRRSVELIEICYASRKPLELPWSAQPASDFSCTV